MLIKNSLARLDVDSYTLKYLLDKLNVPYSSEGKYLHGKKGTYSRVSGKPFVCILNIGVVDAKVNYLGYELTIPKHKLKPIMKQHKELL